MLCLVALKEGSSMKLEAVAGDITKEEVDAIVNAANSSLMGGGGVDGAIHRAAGPELLAACKEIRSTTLPDGLAVGNAVSTPGFNLPARWVIHTVGPNRHRGQTNPNDLANCFTSSLREAVRLGAHSVAFPAISAGVYGWDMEQVADIAINAIVSLRAEEIYTIELVRFVLTTPKIRDLWAEKIPHTPNL